MRAFPAEHAAISPRWATRVWWNTGWRKRSRRCARQRVRFDLIFLDIDREGYPEALDATEEKLRPGGVLLADNLLWSWAMLMEVR